MALIARLLVPYSKCCIHTSCRELSKMPRIMTKLMKGPSKKRKWFDNGVSQAYLPSASSLVETKHQHSKNSNRRVTALNKLFMRHITDQMSCGEIGAKVFGRNIEISRVKIASDFHIVNIFWMARGLIDDGKTENILNEVSGMLRHELSQLKIIGIVPRLQFVRDKSSAKIMEMEMQLAKADFGEDFVPTDPSHSLKSEYLLSTRLESHIVEKIKKIDQDETTKIHDIPLPALSDDIFGLNRSLIVDRILKSKTKSAQAWSGEHRISNNTFVDGVKSVKNSVDLSPAFEKEQFREFLRKRQIEYMKTMKSSSRLPAISEILNENQDVDNMDYEEYDNINEYESDENDSSI